METIHAGGTPLAAYLEGDGYLDRSYGDDNDPDQTPFAIDPNRDPLSYFAPPSNVAPKPRKIRRSLLPQLQIDPTPPNSIRRIHNAWSTAVNSRLGRADNARFIEHFRYVIVASQLLNEYLDQGSMQPTAVTSNDAGATDDASGIATVKTNLYGAVATATIAFVVVYMMHWARCDRSGFVSKSRMALALAGVAFVASIGYAYVRRQWLKFVRRRAVGVASTMTANWQALEVSSSSALSLIQEVELVSKGYRLTTPLPPASRIEDHGSLRRCGKLRKALHKTYASTIPACIDACTALHALIDEDDLEKYFEIYDIDAQDAKEASGEDALSVLEDDPESLKSLRILSYRAGVLRRVTLCSLMALEADGGKPDFYRWRTAIDVMEALNNIVAHSAERLQRMLSEMETLSLPLTPAKASHSPGHERMRTKVRKISMLSSGIKSLQAKMQILREETNRSIEQQDDLTDLGPSLMAQYESIGADLKELMHAWEAGKASLQSKITKQERRISMASSVRSPVSSLGGLTAVEECGTPDDALKALNGDTLSCRSSLATTPSDEEQMFEAIAMPKQRSSLTREERVMKMQEERERQATLRAKRDSNTNMLRELESDTSKQLSAIMNGKDTDDLPKEKRTLSHLIDEGQSVVAAGQVTTTHYLNTTAYHITTNPSILARLKQELPEAMPDGSLAPSQKLEQSPYSSAAINKGYRVSYGVTHRLQRVSPKEHMMYHEYSIPPGTPVGMTSIFMHGNEKFSLDPKAFRKVLPMRSPASTKLAGAERKICPSEIESSSVRQLALYSTCSNQRTGLHSSVQSSVTKWQFGATHVGWMGEMSVPVTFAEGNWSAKSMAQIPVPVPTSRKDFLRGLVEGRVEELGVEEQQENVMGDVESVFLVVVVWTLVLAVPVGMISPSGLEFMSGNGRVRLEAYTLPEYAESLSSNTSLCAYTASSVQRKT
ncbi:hypothetical protein LTR08_006561 [Meristemomyces frigidus]|nr:hypothetical protein LTR08_006561 [Meristemomyces frigidus]